jgi:uncharacterized protein
VERASVDELFADQPACLRLFRAIRRLIEQLGPVEVVATSTQVSFGTRRKFAWVRLPQQWTANRPADSVTLTFSLDHEVVDPRIAEAVEPKPGRWTHHVVIEREADLDETVDGWLRQAYEAATTSHQGGVGNLRERLRRALPTAMRSRDALAVAALRSALAAIDNAEAVDAAGPQAGTGHPELAGTVAGLGAAEVERRTLTQAQMEGIVRAEVADRETAAHDYERAGRHERAEQLRDEAALLSTYLDATEPPPS